MPDGQLADLLGERRHRTTGVTAEEPAHVQSRHHRLTGHRDVGQSTVIAAVDPPGSAAAGRAGTVLRRDTRPHQHT